MNQQIPKSDQTETHHCNYCKRQTVWDVHFNLQEVRYITCRVCFSCKKADKP